MKYIQAASIVTALALIGGAAYGGYLAGEHLTTERMQKQAVAHSCGLYNPQTLAFNWMIQPDIQVGMDSLSPQVRRGK